MDGLDGKKLPKIKPCPFCGSEAKIYDYGRYGYGKYGRYGQYGYSEKS